MNMLAHRLWQATGGRSQFVRFALIGVIGYAVDASALTALVVWGDLDRYSARVLSFLCAASATWWLNRISTCAARPDQRPGRQWLLFVAVNAVGAAVNYGAYVVALLAWPLAYDYPALGAAVGALAGLAFNYPASRLLVFRTGLPAPSTRRNGIGSAG